MEFGKRKNGRPYAKLVKRGDRIITKHTNHKGTVTKIQETSHPFNYANITWDQTEHFDKPDQSPIKKSTLRTDDISIMYRPDWH